MLLSGSKPCYIKSAHLIDVWRARSRRKVPEAIAMKQYAMEQGIPERDILVETNSTTTLENMLYSKEIMDQQMKGPYRVIFSSNNYHIFRAGLYARQAKLKANGIGAKQLSTTCLMRF
ncbi:YdcF family protein [Enterococcus lactis]|nr:YdcF family protein [Enterococcus lactis]